MDKIRLIISILLFLLGFSTIFFDLLTLSKIAIEVALLIIIVVLNINGNKILLVKKFILLVLVIVMPIMYYLGFNDYNMFINRIVFEKTYNGVTCKFDNYDATFYITGSGESPSFGGQYDIDWKDYRKGIQNVVISDGITAIGSTSFCNSKSLVEVKCPDSIQVIYKFSFMNCNKLYKFNTDKAFTIVIPKETIAILDSAFYGCDRIKYLYLYKNIKLIDIDAFNCENLTDIYFEGTEEEWNAIIISEKAFLENINIHFNEKF